MAGEKTVLAVIRASRPSFRNNHDKLAFAVHASFLSSGFVLTATGPPAFADNPPSTDEVGIEGWNQVEDEYAFVYINPEKANKKVLVKCLVMGDKFMVDALSDGASEPVHMEINVDDHVAETSASDYNAQYKNLGKLVSSLDSEVLSKLDGSAGARVAGPSRPSGSVEPSRDTDQSESPQDPPTGYVLPPVNPGGYSDIYPGPGAGMYPGRGDFGGGSSLLGPNDPRWFGGGDGFPIAPRGPGGRGVPPGARFDPYGPPGVPGFEPFPQWPYPQGPIPGGGPNPDLLPPGGRMPGGRLHPDLEQPGSGGFDYI